MRADNAGGLLWFDDDARRPIQEKIAEAAQRYRERVGYEPTVCQLNPAQASALASGNAPGVARPKRGSANAKPAAPPVELRLVPSDLIQPHCYLITIGEGETPKPATLPYRDEDEPRRRAVAVEQGSRSYRLGRAPKVTPAAIPTPKVTVSTARKAILNAAAGAAAAPASPKPATATGAVTMVTKAKRKTANESTSHLATKKAATAKKTSEKTKKVSPAGQTIAQKPTAVVAAPTTPAKARVAKKAAKAPAVEQPTLMSVVPEKAARTAKTKPQAAPTASAEPALVATATSARRAAKKVASSTGFQAPTLPLIEAEPPRPRRSRKQVA